MLETRLTIASKHKCNLMSLLDTRTAMEREMVNLNATVNAIHTQNSCDYIFIVSHCSLAISSSSSAFDERKIVAQIHEVDIWDSSEAYA